MERRNFLKSIFVAPIGTALPKENLFLGCLKVKADFYKETSSALTEKEWEGWVDMIIKYPHQKQIIFAPPGFYNLLRRTR